MCVCVCVCVFYFISQEFLVSLALSHPLLKSSLYITTKPICGIDGFLLTFVLTPLSASISIYYLCVSAGPLQHNGSAVGGMVGDCRFEGTHRCCCQMLFFGDLYGLRLQRLSTSVKLLPALPLSHHTWALFMLPPPPPPSLLSILPSPLSPPLFLYHHHHHIHCEGSAPASCSTITSPNPPPSVCISAVLIAPETQSNGQEMRPGVQLTGSPLSSLSSLPRYPFHICPLSQALCGLLCSP